MNTLSFKGYSARVEFDERDEVFVGRILGIRDIISFHGESVGELRSAFEHAVSDYLAECEEAGVSPQKPASGKLLLRVPPDVHGQAIVAAQAAGLSLNQWAMQAIQHAIQPRS
jgi:predicted HicB family RNase H-like nuclease